MHALRIFLIAIGVAVVAGVRVAPQSRTLVITRVNVVEVVAGQIPPNSSVTISGQTGVESAA
jgi:hypothetical protein